MRWLEPEKTHINLSKGKSICAIIFKAKPLGTSSTASWPISEITWKLKRVYYILWPPSDNHSLSSGARAHLWYAQRKAFRISWLQSRRKQLVAAQGNCKDRQLRQTDALSRTWWQSQEWKTHTPIVNINHKKSNMERNQIWKEILI